MSKELIASLVKLFERDLDKLSKEVTLYADEKSIWELRGEIKNTAGNLCLHLCGNLQFYIGTMIGGTGYVRDRDLEFSETFRPREQLLTEIEKTRSAVVSTLQKIDPDLMDTNYPENVLGYPMTHTFFLVHLAGHFNYHLGQINYHRRLIG
jgi:hypothetical protein